MSLGDKRSLTGDLPRDLMHVYYCNIIIFYYYHHHHHHYYYIIIIECMYVCIIIVL